MDDEPIYLKRPGVIPGERGYSNDPATYESDLWEAEMDRVLGDDDEVADALIEEGHDREIARIIAWMYGRVLPMDVPKWQAALSGLDEAVERVVKERLAKRRRDAVIY